MRKPRKSLLIILIVLVIFVVVGITKAFGQKDEKLNVVSGVIDPKEDDIDSAGKDYYATVINSYDSEPNWEPGENFGTSNQPEVAASEAFLIDVDTGQVLFDKNSSERRKIASLTKIMTAVLALEHLDLDDTTTVSYKAANTGENAMGISEGETYTIEELMYGLILNSGNDAAVALAESAAGDTDTFVKWMNIKAGELGLKNTYFADPSGLDDSTYSSAVDLVKLTRYALKSPEFRKVAATTDKELVSDTHKYLYLSNQTNLLTTYPGVKGVKTGYTEEAGLCLVTYAANEGKDVIGVVLNSVDRKGDMILMLDHGFGSLGVNVEHNLLDY